jgi:hypothetical protein
MTLVYNKMGGSLCRPSSIETLATDLENRLRESNEKDGRAALLKVDMLIRERFPPKCILEEATAFLVTLQAGQTDHQTKLLINVLKTWVKNHA